MNELATTPEFEFPTNLPTTFRISDYDLSRTNATLATAAMERLIREANRRGVDVISYFEHCTLEWVWTFKLPPGQEGV